MGEKNTERSKEKNTDTSSKDNAEPSNEANSSAAEPQSIHDEDDVPLLDFTTGSLGVILIVLVGIFMNQFGKLYAAYLELDDTHLHGRGVARIRLGDGVEREIASFVERNEPFVIRSCLPTNSFWEEDANLLQTLGPDAVLPVRVANRTTDDKIPTQFRRAVAPGTRGKDSAYVERNMTVADFLESYNNHESREHLYAAQIDVMSALPNLLPHIQETAPPKTTLEAVGKTPPRSSRPIR